MTEKPIPTIDDVNRLYFEGTQLDELRIRHCLDCGARFRFAHPWCPDCWSGNLHWEVSKGYGRISHFSVVHQAPSGAFAADLPYVLALVELDEGVRMMTNVVDCDPAEVRVGLPVSIVFEQRGAVKLPMARPFDA